MQSSCWQSWQERLTVKPTLHFDLPPLRMLLVLDDLADHKTPEFDRRLFEIGIIPPYTPVGGSWLYLSESIQRVLERRAFDGQYPTDTAQIIACTNRRRGTGTLPRSRSFGAAGGRPVVGGNASCHHLGGSGACSRFPVPRHAELWPQASQVSHLGRSGTLNEPQGSFPFLHELPLPPERQPMGNALQTVKEKRLTRDYWRRIAHCA